MKTTMVQKYFFPLKIHPFVEEGRGRYREVERSINPIMPRAHESLKTALVVSCVKVDNELMAFTRNKVV